MNINRLKPINSILVTRYILITIDISPLSGTKGREARKDYIKCCYLTIEAKSTVNRSVRSSRSSLGCAQTIYMLVGCGLAHTAWHFLSVSCHDDSWHASARIKALSVDYMWILTIVSEARNQPQGPGRLSLVTIKVHSLAQTPTGQPQPHSAS